MARSQDDSHPQYRRQRRLEPEKVVVEWPYPGDGGNTAGTETPGPRARGHAAFAPEGPALPVADPRQTALGAEMALGETGASRVLLRGASSDTERPGIAERGRVRRFRLGHGALVPASWLCPVTQ